MKLKRLSLLVAPTLFAACTGTSNISDTDTSAAQNLDATPAFSAQDRADEAAWVTGIFNENYGMLEVKESKWGFAWDKTVADFKAAATADNMSREDFEALTAKLVAQMHDAHTAPTFYSRLELNEPYYATLGFFTARDVDAQGNSHAKVTRVFSRVLGAPAPVQVGDEIVSIDGRDVATIVNEDILPYRNLGQPETNLTYGYSSIGLRGLYSLPKAPKGPAKVTLNRNGQAVSVALNWLSVETSALQSSPSEAKKAKVAKIMAIGPDGTVTVQMNGPRMITQAPPAMSQLPASLGMQLAYQRDVATLADINGQAPGADYPSTATKVTLDDLEFHLQLTQKGLVAIYRVDDFESSRMKCGEPVSVGIFMISTCTILSGEDYAAAFNQLKNLGVQALVLDLRSNPGGVLDWGYELVRAFSRDSFQLNPASVRLNIGTLGGYRAAAAANYLPAATRAAYQAQLDTLEKDVADGKRMSSPVYLGGVDTLPGVAAPWEGKTYVLTDEMCASMCDIFSTLMQDLKLAKVVGTQSMGAGGNVVDAGVSPHLMIDLTQTASVIYRLDGSVIENAGATPDFPVSTFDPQFFTKLQAVIESN